MRTERIDLLIRSLLVKLRHFEYALHEVVALKFQLSVFNDGDQIVVQSEGGRGQFLEGIAV